MNSLIFNSMLDDLARGFIDFEVDTFKAMLVTSFYVPDKNAHAKRSDVVADEVAGVGYFAGGEVAIVDVVREDDWIDVLLGGINWPVSTITAAGAIYYKSRNNGPRADELITYIAFDSDVRSIRGTFHLDASVLRVRS
jgi:hypothetical protein